MRIVFFGSDDFANIHFQTLIDNQLEVVGCVTVPDRAKGRGMKVSANEVKESALSQKIPLFQPENIKDEFFKKQLADLDAQLFVVIAYGKILPKAILDLPSLYAINVHSSLLPKYRGAAPINWALMNGETKTGISIIKMNEKMDAGDIIAQMDVPIKEEDTAVSLRERMMEAGPAFLLKTIEKIREGTVKPTAQNESDVSLAPKLTKDLGQINWHQPAEKINNLIRALLPWPGAYTRYNGKFLKILAAKVVESKESARPGEVVDINKDGFTVAASTDALRIERVHLEASKEMDTASFLRGQKLEKGFCFD